MLAAVFRVVTHCTVPAFRSCRLLTQLGCAFTKQHGLVSQEVYLLADR